MEISEIKDRNSLEKWLEDKPIEWAQAIAARLALRVAPLAWSVAALSEDQLPEKHRLNLTLLTFRANFISSAARKYPADDMRAAADAAYAVDAAAYAAAYAAADAAVDAADAAYAAADAAVDAADAAYAANAAYAAADAAYAAADAAVDAADAAYAADDIWESIRADCEWLEGYNTAENADLLLNTTLSRSQFQTSQLIVYPLWLIKDEGNWVARNRPNFLAEAFREFYRSDLAINTSFGLIADWYQQALRGHTAFGPNADKAIATMSPEDWEGDPIEVMDRVAKIAGWERKTDDGVVGDGEEVPEGLPEANAIPPQNIVGEQISSFRDGPLRPISDPLQAGIDLEQQAIYDEVRGLLSEVKDQFPTQELEQCVGLIDAFLDQPKNLSDVQFTKVLWLRGNALRSRLARHDAVSNAAEPHYDKLPPAVAEAFRAPVEAWNVMVVGDQKLRSLDAIRRGPKEFSELKAEANAAKPVLEAASENRDIVSEELSEVVHVQIGSAERASENIHGDQALELANATSQNINGEILSGAYQTVLKVYGKLSTEAKVAGGIVAGGVGAAAGQDFWIAIKGSWVYVEFIAANPEIMKHYISVAYGNPALERVVDFIKQIRDRYSAQ